MKKINQLLKKLHIKFNNEELLQQALTHSSYSNENDTDNNERLEFLGDAVIGLLMGEYLYNKGIKTEGQMSKRRAEAVCEEALNLYAKHINLKEYLRLGKGSIVSGNRDNPSIIADAFEAVFGAIYLDQGFEKTKEVFYKIVIPHVKHIDIRDYKSTLQEFVQTDRKNIAYHLESQSGPSHDKTFTVSVRMDDIVLGIGVAKTKKEAEQKAAEIALSILAKE